MPNAEVILIVRTIFEKQEFLCMDVCQKMMASANLETKSLKKNYNKVFPDKFNEKSMIFKAIE